MSNLSGYNIDCFIPIINPPQVTIVGVGRMRTGATGQQYCTISLVFDHRVADGAESCATAAED